MGESHVSVAAADRVALLRDGIVVVEAHGPPLRVGVTGAGGARVREIVARRLGADVETDVLGNVPRRLAPRRCIGFREREPGRLQLRLLIRGDEHVDDIVVAEDERSVVVLATVCTSVTGEEGAPCDVPCHVYLERPLRGRAVIDGTYGTAVPCRAVARDSMRV